MGTANPDFFVQEKWISGFPAYDESYWIPVRNVQALAVQRGTVSGSEYYHYRVSALVGGVWIPLTSLDETFAGANTKLHNIVQQLQEPPNPYAHLGELIPLQEGDPDDTGTTEGQEVLQEDHGP